MEFEGTPIVIDVGSRLTKVGLANEPEPTHLFPTIVARPKNFRRSSEMPDDIIKIGQEAEEITLGDIRDYSIKYPVEWGLITNWELFEDLMEHILFNLMKGRHENTPVLLTEVPLNPRVSREKCVQLMFETFDAGAVYVANTASLTAFSSGTLDGVVFECGYDTSYITPVYDGICLRFATPKCVFSSSDIYWHLEQLLEQKMTSEHPESRWTFAKRHHRHVVRDIVNKHGYFALDYALELQKTEDGLLETMYSLPDGTVINVAKELVESTEVLFDPSIRGDEYPSISRHIQSVINFIKSPEVKEAVSGNIIIGGAITTLPGFIERLEKEVNIDFNSEGSNTNLCQTISAKQLWKVRDLSNRQYSAWIGGSVLASMSNFESKCITKEEYDEYGPIMVHRKCFL